MISAAATMRVAMIHEVFHDDPGGESLRAHLERARADGADLAVLPELPLNSWAPHSKASRDEDAEALNGPRQQIMAAAACDLGIGLVGGVILRDKDTGARHNTALVYGPDGGLLARYRKIHLPEEDGYWETSHYEPGQDAPEAFAGLPLRTGLQICSDVNRPQGFQLLAAQGAEVVLAPRATPPGSWERWRVVLRANAVMSGTYLISVNRPRPEHGAPIGGPSVAIAPSGVVLAETEEPVTVVELTRSDVEGAAAVYPGYLERFPDIYARGWGRLTG
jgi:predicted amidohydrolase